MLKSNDPRFASSTDRAVTLAALSLLPLVCGGFVVRSLWMTPEESPRPAASAAKEEIAANMTQPQREQRVRPSAWKPLPAPVHAASIAAEAAVVEKMGMAHAPLELTDVQRSIVAPLAFAPRTLSECCPLDLRNELQAVAVEVDLYGDAPEPDNRFGEMKQMVSDERSKRAAQISDVQQRMRTLQAIRLRKRARGGDTRLPFNRQLQRTQNELRKLKNSIEPTFQPLKAWLTGRADLQGLPLVMGEECRLDPIATGALHRVSTEFRSFRRDVRFVSDETEQVQKIHQAVAGTDWTTNDIPGLMQVVTAEKVPLRLELVRILAENDSRESSVALARLAIFDLSADVRNRAVAVLDGRPREEYRETLLDGLRYVWPPAADNAARALVALNDVAAYTALVQLAREGDPRAPYRNGDFQWVADEFVRVNHMRNCLLCHSPAVSPGVQLTGAVPSPYEPLPDLYYENASYLVRADVTYLRQDFSVMHAVDDYTPWLPEQRFDYLVRQRPLSDTEAVELTDRYSDGDYPQREAVLFAMRGLRQNMDGASPRHWLTSTDRPPSPDD